MVLAPMCIDMSELTQAEIEQAIDTLQEAQNVLSEQGHYESESTLDKAEAILAVGFSHK